MLQIILKSEISDKQISGNINQNILNTQPNDSEGGTILSENQKSKTFRSVGPFEDSTKYYNGKKYSQMYRTPVSRDTRSGYYGRSRLTRF